MLLLRTVVRAEDVTAIVATHDPMMLEVADRVVELRDGVLVGAEGHHRDPAAGPGDPAAVPRDAAVRYAPPERHLTGPS